jgi:hypothetical protein
MQVSAAVVNNCLQQTTRWLLTRRFFFALVLVAKEPHYSHGPIRSPGALARSFTDPGQWNSSAPVGTSAVAAHTRSYSYHGGDHTPMIITTAADEADAHAFLADCEDGTHDYIKSLESIMRQLQNPRENTSDGLVMAVTECISHDVSAALPSHPLILARPK